MLRNAALKELNLGLKVRAGAAGPGAGPRCGLAALGPQAKSLKTWCPEVPGLEKWHLRAQCFAWVCVTVECPMAPSVSPRGTGIWPTWGTSPQPLFCWPATGSWCAQAYPSTDGPVALCDLLLRIGGTGTREPLRAP